MLAEMSGSRGAAEILIVDDSVTVRQQLRSALEEAGFAVFEASNASQGIDQARGRRFALIIADVNMPGMDGLEMIQAVRRLPDHRTTPIFVLTTESTADVVKRGREAGATAWIVKPFQPRVLLEGITKTLARAT
jgi:two-component system chemotaxis response regulator CheY